MKGVDTPKPNAPSSAPDGLITRNTVIAGRYRVEEHLGEGGMGTVYAAHDQLIDQPVAVKFIKASFAKSPRMMDALRQEVRLSQRVTHHNVARTYTMEESEGRLFVVMELLRGRRLSDEIHDGPLPVQRALSIAHQIALGLSAAHEREVVHRDIKPQNVTLCEDGRAVVMDFGIARVLGASATVDPGLPSGVRQTSFGGTPGYMAPEAFRGDPVGPSADLYGLGLVLYEMLVGAPPFVSDDPVALMMMHVEEPSPRVDALRTEVPNGVADIVQKLLAKHPQERFATARDVARALSRFGFLDHGRFSSVPKSVPSFLAPQTRRVSRTPLALVLVVAVAALALWFFRPPADTQTASPRTLVVGSGGAPSVAPKQPTEAAAREEPSAAPVEPAQPPAPVETTIQAAAPAAKPSEPSAVRKLRAREVEKARVEESEPSPSPSGATQRRRRLLDLEE